MLRFLKKHGKKFVRAGLLIAINYADIIYKNSYRITFYQNCVRNADNPAKSDYCGLVFIFNSFCNVADI